MDLLSPYPSYPNPTSQQSPSDSLTYGSSPARNLGGSFDSPNLSNTTPSIGNVNIEQYSSNEAEDRQRQFSALKEQQRNLKLLQEQRKREEELKAQSNSNSYFAPSTSYPRSNIPGDNLPESIISPYSILNSTPTSINSNANSLRTGEQQSSQLQSLSSSSIDTQLIEKLNHFMRSVESKLDGLDRQVQQLTLDFKLNNTKQERASDLLNGRFRELEDQIRTLKVSSPPASTPIPSSVQPSASSIHHQSPSIPSYHHHHEQSYKPPVPQNNTDKDEEFAKQLQAELDREAASSSAPSSNPSNTSTTYPNLGMYSSPSSNQHVTPGGPSSSPMVHTDDGSAGGVNSCPICGIQLPVKQLHEHIEFQHFQNDNRGGATLQGPTPDGKSQSEGFFSKLFGGKKQSEVPQSSELRPPSYVYGQKPVAVQQIPPQPVGSVPPGSMVPYGYPPSGYAPQPIPSSQVVYRPPSNVPYYNGSIQYGPK